MFFKASKPAIYAAMGVALASMGSAAMADVLVTRSSGAIAREHPRGSRIADNATIQLRAGDEITVLTSDGARRFSRPGRYRINAAMRVASSSVTTRGRNGIARTGVTRGLDRPSTWDLNVNGAGAYCIANGEPGRLWRSDSSQAQEVTITRIADNQSMTVTIPEDSNDYSWTGDFATPAGTYMIVTGNGQAHTHVEFIDIEVDLLDPIAVGAALLENACDAQLEVFTANAPEVEATDG